MEINEKEENLLVEIFYQSHKNKKWADGRRFRVDFSDDIEIIENLVNRNLIKWNSGEDTYRITFGAMCLIQNNEINKVFFTIKKLFNELKLIYTKTYDDPIGINDLSKLIDLPRSEVIEGVLYLKDMISFGRSLDLSAGGATISPSEMFVRYKNFSDVIDKQLEQWANLKPRQHEEKKSRPNQIDKMICQAVGKTLWLIDREMTIADMIEHKAIQEYAGGRSYSHKTLRIWLSEVDPRDKKSETGRPKKKIKTDS